MGSIRHSVKDEGTAGAMLRMSEVPRDNGKQMSVGILGQMKRNADAKKHTKDSAKSSSAAYTTRRKQNSFKSFRPNGDDKSWLVCALVSFFIIGLLVTGAVVGIKYSAVGGWSVFALGVVLFAVITVGLCVNRRKRLEKNNALQAAEPPKFYHTDINDFPYDPVLQRGVTNLTYHGQRDCRTCSMMRESDDKRRKVTPPHDHNGCQELFLASENNDGASVSTAPSSGSSGYAPMRSHHVVVHQEGLVKRYKPQGHVIDHADQEETSFIASSETPSGAKPPELLALNDKHNHNNNHATHAYANAIGQPNSQSGGEPEARDANAAVISRDSFLTTKKRRKQRNKEWKSRGKVPEDAVAVESLPSDDSYEEEESGGNNGHLPYKTADVMSTDASSHPLSRDSFLSIKKRKMQRIEEWERRRSGKGASGPNHSGADET